uniref:HAT C-terminal dimerisation domain-containing protein n=1 Tax=Latimeria chalumnae TaxID=7897 RepID=H3BG61_LATCH
CDVCHTEKQCAHQGKCDVERPIASQDYQDKVKALKSYQMTSQGAMSQLEYKARRTEVKVTNFIACHNLPLAVANQLTLVFADILPDSKIAKKSAAKTKTTCIPNGALKPYFLEETMKHLQKEPFFLSTEGSNDTEIQKVNPITVKLFDVNDIHHQFLDMGITVRRHSATAEVIFQGIDHCFQQYNIPWYNCVSFSLDNTSVNMSKHNSLMSRAKEKKKGIYICGCPCHIIHNTISKASAEFAQETGFDLDDFCTNASYWFAKSTKRKARWEEYCQFCDQGYKTIIDHVSTRWLSLEIATNRTVHLYRSLKSYFLSETGSQARFKHLKKAFLSPITEVYLMFFQHIFPLFTNLNKLLQREEPLIYFVYQEMQKFLKKILAEAIVQGGSDLSKVDYKNLDKQLDDAHIFIGSITRATLTKGMKDDDINEISVKFFAGVHVFYVKTCAYAMENLPLDDEVLHNAPCIDYTQCLHAHFTQVQYFVQRFDKVLPYSIPEEEEKLSDEFLDYQTMRADGQKEEFYCKDVIWGYLTTMKESVLTLLPRFPRLGKMAKLILSLPHSNTNAEQVFSLVCQNKTAFRDRLSLEGTLSSLLTVKVARPESEGSCYRFKPPEVVITASKKVTWEYNKKHQEVSI